METPYNIIGIGRGNEYSPNHVGNDAAILEAVANELRKLGHAVDLCDEYEFVARGLRPKACFSMARHRAAIERLKELEDGGAVVVNSGYGIDNCTRATMTRLLLQHGIPHPESAVVSTDAPFAFDGFPCWIKRGDLCAVVKEDVCFVADEAGARLVMEDFRRRGIPVAVVNRHLPGDLVKFYGVSGTDFFYWFYPSPSSHSKFGLEVHNGEARGIPFDAAGLKRHCDRAARVLDVPVYGGDCIVSADGSVRLIDFNDWPSFARCRAEAAPHIAACIHGRLLSRFSRSGE